MERVNNILREVWLDSNAEGWKFTKQAAITHTAVRQTQNGNERDAKDNSKRRTYITLLSVSI